MAACSAHVSAQLHQLVTNWCALWPPEPMATRPVCARYRRGACIRNTNQVRLTT